MKDILLNARKILGIALTLLALAALGFFTDNPRVMVPVYFVFFLAVFSGIYLYNNYRFKNTKKIVGVRTEKREAELMRAQEAKRIPHIIQGSILLLLSLFVPTFVFRDVGFTFGIHILLFFSTLVMILLAIIAVYMINKKTLLHGIIGYVLLILISSMPALLMTQHDRSYHALGTAYYTALIITIIAWYGSDLLLKNINLPDFLKK